MATIKYCLSCSIQISSNPHNLRCRKCASLLRPQVFKTGVSASPRTTFKSGEKHPNYQFGTRELGRLVRMSNKYQKYREEVRIRDGHACVLCGSNEKLNIDHYPETFAELITKLNLKNLTEVLDCIEFWNPSLSRTLCQDCHTKTPSYTWRLNG